ncbi:MAG: protein kinase domain-containing protein [Solirubrobacterales bacterium]
MIERVFKHDFLAATALYKSATHKPRLPERLVCKTGREMHFCLIPLGWLGRLVTGIEVRRLACCKGIAEVPRVLARPRPNVYAYEYIEGTSLGEEPALPPDFFDQLLAAVEQIHAKNIVHFDLHKPGNILVDNHGRPHIIDFQLSLHVGDRALLSKWLSHRFRLWLQSYDIYHVCKHKRKLQPERLTRIEEQLSRNRTLPLQVHRAVARPYKWVRRACLRYLCARGVLVAPDDPRTSPETNPARWVKKK